MKFKSTNNTPSGHPQQLHPMVVLQPGEQVLCDIKRHPFGILSVYIAGLIGIIAVVAIASFAPSIATQYNYAGDATSLAILGVIIASIGIGSIMFLSTYIYWQNRWVVTDDSITQIIQNSLLGRRVSQLSMEHLEDVTVDQHGLLPTMFNFGTLRVETAGEHSKFFFLYCPDPNKYARKILEIHEAFLYQRRHDRRDMAPVEPIHNQYSAAAGSQPSQFYQQPQPAVQPVQQNGQPQEYLQPAQPVAATDPWGQSYQQQPAQPQTSSYPPFTQPPVTPVQPVEQNPPLYPPQQ